MGRFVLGRIDIWSIGDGTVRRPRADQTSHRRIDPDHRWRLGFDLGGSGWSGVIGLAILGLGMAAVFPGLVSLTPDRVGGDQTETALGYQLAVAGLGAAFLPWLTGVLAEQLTVEVLGPVLLIGSLVLAVAWWTVRSSKVTVDR